MKAEARRTILIAGMGTSPAILTETVWALAHQKPAVVPDEIVVLTTRSGKDVLRSAVMSGTPSIWERLKAGLRKEKIDIDGKLLFGDASIRIIPDAQGTEAGDLRTGEDNLRAADFMLGQVRQYTESSDTVLLASIAGGRKTMSALLFSCMTLLGREDDRVYHVLIPPECECGMEPPFFFPQRGVTHHLLDKGRPTGKKIASAKIGIELFEVPFVRMRGWYQENFKTIPPSYHTLISRVQTVAPPARTYPKIKIDAWSDTVWVDGNVYRLTPQEFAMLIVLANGVSDQEEVYRRLSCLKRQTQTDGCDWIERFVGLTKFSVSYEKDPKLARNDVSDVMSSLRKTFEGYRGMESLIPMRGHMVSFPANNIKWVNKERLADICGYLFSPQTE